MRSNEHLLTPANLMTAARLGMATMAGWKLAKGEGVSLPFVMAAAATDFESKPADLIDKIKPGSGYGRTELGKAADPIVDSIAFVEIGLGALASPRISHLGKASVGIVLVSESIKSVWAGRENLKHRKETGKQLVITPTMTGKVATTLKAAASINAIRTNELKPGAKRNAHGVAAVVSAVTGALLGEKARRGYMLQLKK
jgi:hypothetical protein